MWRRTTIKCPLCKRWRDHQANHTLSGIALKASGADEVLVDSDVTDLPTTFDALVVKATKEFGDHAAYCKSPTADEVFGGWPRWVRDPGLFYEQCRDGYVEPDAGPSAPDTRP